MLPSRCRSLPVVIMLSLLVAPAAGAATKKKAVRRATTTTRAVATTIARSSTTSPATTSPTTTPVTTVAAVTTTVPALVRGGTIVAAISSDPGSLNPAITTSGAVHTGSELMFNGLVELDDKGNPTPELAESWTVSSGDYTFKLRHDVQWHDGVDFTSADVKYTFEEALDKFHARTRGSVGDSLFSIETPDPYTVTFRFFKPYAPFLQQLNVTEAPILPKHIYAGTDVTRNPANLKPIGTGPFKFESYKPGSEVRMSANKNYFKKGLPYADAVVLRVIPDPSNQLIALEAGEIDFLFGVPGPDLARTLANKNIGTIETLNNPGGSNCITSMSFNLDKPLFSDQRTRQAIFQATDRKQFLDRIQFGQGRVADAPIASGIAFAHAKNLQLPAFDRSAANRLLDEVGWKRSGSNTRVADNVAGVKDGTALRFRFLTQPAFAPYGQLLRAQLAEVGIDVQVETLEPAAFAERIFTRRDFDTNVISYCNATDPEVGVRRMVDSKQIGPVAFSNSSGYKNPAVDALFEKGVTAEGNEARGKAYVSAQEILAVDLPYVWILETTGVRAFRSACTGFTDSGHFAEAASCKK